MKCPKCGKKTLRGKELYEGGGVECMNAKCDYWFCYSESKMKKCRWCGRELKKIKDTDNSYYCPDCSGD